MPGVSHVWDNCSGPASVDATDTDPE